MAQISREDCDRIHELRDRGYWIWLIAEEMDVSRYCVEYHLREECKHNGAQR